MTCSAICGSERSYVLLISRAALRSGSLKSSKLRSSLRDHALAQREHLGKGIYSTPPAFRIFGPVFAVDAEMYRFSAVFRRPVERINLSADIAAMFSGS